MTRRHRCSLCTYTSFDSSNAKKHELKCKIFGGPIDKRNKHYATAMHMSLNSCGSKAETFKFLSFLEEADEGKPSVNTSSGNIQLENACDLVINLTLTSSAPPNENLSTPNMETTEKVETEARKELNKTEQFFQDLLTKKYNGTRIRNVAGVTDVTTDKFHMEIKLATNWKSGIRQLLAYNASEKRAEMRLCLFNYDKPFPVKTKQDILQHCMETKVSLYILDQDGEDNLVFSPIYF